VVVRTIIPERIDFFSCTLRAGVLFLWRWLGTSPSRYECVSLRHDGGSAATAAI
jgi:hypothetical protein